MIIFYFLFFPSFSNQFWHEMKPQWYFLNFFVFFCSFFGIFYYASGRNGTERKFLFYLIHILFQPIFARNVARLVVFYILNFLAIFLKFCITRWLGTKRNENFYFYLSHHFPTYFGLKWIHNGIFQFFFLIFLLFFWNFYY